MIVVNNENISQATSGALAQETTLQAVLIALNNVDANTDQAEALLSDVITEIQNNGSVNNTNLLAVISKLNDLDVNTTNLESILNSIATNTAIATNTILSIETTGSGNTPASVKSVTFTCYTGSELINGAGIPTSAITSLSYDKDNDLFASIPYDANGGKIRIDYFF